VLLLYKMDNKYGAKNSPLLLYQPYTLALWLTFYSPIIVALCVTSMSFYSQNFKGFVYLAWLLVFTWFRSLLYEVTGSPKTTTSESNTNICDIVQYSQYGNSGFSVYFIAFTIVYICTPMFMNQEMNYFVLSGILFYLLLNTWIRSSKQCFMNMTDIFLNLVGGLFTGAIAVSIMYAANISKYLFFNELSSNKEVCSQPKKQTFRCAVYKNGEVIGTVNQ
jgi:hypothetical protein